MTQPLAVRWRPTTLNTNRTDQVTTDSPIGMMILLGINGVGPVGGHTVAILSNGLDKESPVENRALAEQIVDRGGALVSEQPLGVPAMPRNLIQRNRIQSGMSVGTIVMQTSIRGDSMHTVRFTLLTKGITALCTVRISLLSSVPRGPSENCSSQGFTARLLPLTWGPKLDSVATHCRLDAC